MNDTGIRANIQSFYAGVEMPGGYSFDHVDNIKTIDNYYNSKFTSGQYDSRGFRKFFYNISKPACDIATKFIDLDTKDILLTSKTSGDEMLTWLMQRDLKQWMIDTEFGTLLNEIGFRYPKYGHVIIKKSGDRWFIVNIENIRTDIASGTLKDSSFVYEAIAMSHTDISDMNWNGKDLKALLDTKNAEYLVYELHHKNETGGYDRMFVSGLFGNTDVDTPESLINKEEKEGAVALVLHEDTVTELPYRELKWEDVPGRWSGFGDVEYLFDNQIRMNELVNIKAKALYYTSLKIYQTQDDTVGNNILTDMENGDILKVSKEITQINNEERNLAPFAQEEARWDTNSERKTFSFDIARGETLPSRTPVGVARLSAGMVASFYDIKRENFGLFIKSLILDDIIPNFVKNNQDEHMLTISGSDNEIEMVRQAKVDAEMRKFVFASMKKGLYPNAASRFVMRKKIEKDVLKKKNMYVKIPAEYYKNAKSNVNLLITGEQIDTGAQFEMLQLAVQLFGTNPQILQNPVSRMAVMKLLEIGGLSPIELGVINRVAEQAPQIPVTQGGSVAAPSVSGQPVGGQMTSEI